MAHIPKNKRFLSQGEQDWLRKNYKKGTLIKCAKYLQCDRKTLVRIINDLGLPTPAELVVNVYKDISKGYWNRLVSSAQVRNFEFNITPEYVWSIYEDQHKLCALSKEPIVFLRNLKLCTASVDRINSSIGYIPGNIQILHKIINRIKSDFNQDDLIYWCSKIAYYN